MLRLREVTLIKEILFQVVSALPLKSKVARLFIVDPLKEASFPLVKVREVRGVEESVSDVRSVNPSSSKDARRALELRLRVVSEPYHAPLKVVNLLFCSVRVLSPDIPS